jgi:predicted Zn-dependent protease with MMP-like domain
MFKRYFIFSLLIYSSLSSAGGPLVLEGPSGTTPATYQNPNITLHIESGDLGILTNAAADALVLDAFQLWNDVSTSTVNLIVDQTLIDVDIDLSNFETYLPNIAGTEFNSDDNLNPIVYDDDGEIIDAFFGVGQSNNTIGFAASIITVGSSYFSEGYAVINGKDLGLTTTTFKLLIAHEIGHFLGLDHTQVDINNLESIFGAPSICSTRENTAYPLMYPFVCRDEETLHLDDISAISALYPSSDFNNNFGILQGRFVDETNRAILGANIWAENMVTGETVSIVSDYLTQGTGFYKLHLPEGNYTLHVNSINTLFYGGSGVGPYSLNQNDISFIDPHPITEVSFQGDTPGSDEIISITNNEAQIIDFAINGETTIIASADEDDDSFADLFGATSHLTLATIFGLLVAGRLYRKRKQPGDRS